MQFSFTSLPHANLFPDDGLLDDTNSTLYRSMVGKLIFAANTAGPDLAYAVSCSFRYIKASENKL